MPVGKCRMCLHEKTLVRSHLMPAALYDYCRKGEHRPIKVGGGFVIPTDRQTQDYLLCEDCEGVLNNGGERWTLDKLATWERTFPLYDLLTKAPPLFDEEGMVVYLAAKNPEIEVEKLTHFAWIVLESFGAFMEGGYDRPSHRFGTLFRRITEVASRPKCISQICLPHRGNGETAEGANHDERSA